MMTTMRVARFRRTGGIGGTGGFGVEEVDLPQPQAGELRIRVEACGICGTDLHFLHNGLMPDGHTPGHEMAGVVDAVGAGVDDLEPGRRVAIEPLMSCGQCDVCRSGRDNICRGTRLLGVHLPGGFGEYVIVSRERAFPLAEGLTPAVAALTEPVAVGVHGLRRGGLERGQRVLVLGAGAVGLVTALTARQMGAGEVWISARHAHQAEAARALGATRVIGESEASPDALAAEGLRTDFDLVVETVGGRADTLRSACAAVRPGGTISVLGVFMGSVEVDPYPLLLKEGTLVWSNCYDRQSPLGADFAVATQIVDEERERLQLLSGDPFPLESIGKAFERAADKRSGALKVTVHP